jgi:prostaglandin-endoperoxide synthase 2
VLFTLFAQWFTDGFLRTKRVANEGQLRDARLSESTNEIDLSQLYGLSCEQTIQLRTMVGGRLKSQVIDGEEYPEYYCHAGLPKAQFDRLLPRVGFDGIGLAERDRLFAMASDVTNLSVVAFNTLFLREHNRIADHLSAAQPSWNDEQLFETARNTLVVVLLKLVVEEYINHITPNHFQFRLLPGRFDRQPWYRSNWMAIEFNLLYRWHSLVPSTFLLDGRPLTIEETLWDTKVVTQAGLGRVMAAASTQAAGRIGLFNTHEFLVERADLTSIKQARVARLASYNDYRRLCGLPPAANFADINPSDPAVRAALAARYATAEDVEFYPGLFAEPLVPNCVLPELMLTMVAFDAFSQALTNPLLSPQVFNKQTFSATGLKIIRTTNSLSEIVHRNLPAGSPQYPVTFTRPDFVRE